MPHEHDDNNAHTLLPSEPALRVRALETILTRKGLVSAETLTEIIDIYAHKIGPHIGAKIVARAWTDPDFKQALLTNAETVLGEMGLAGRQGEHVQVVENTADIHNMVVCTFCSCYPWPLLGIPPSWYKSDAYRKRAVREPRTVLAEFGMMPHPSQSVRVWDSTAEMRYLVLPMMPAAAAGCDAEALAQWVTRDSMIGTGSPKAPQI